MTTFLNFNEHIVAISARLHPMFQLGRSLVTTGRAINRELWPELSVDVPPTVLCNQLAAAPSRVHEWHRSAARAGSRRALEFVVSWYPGVSMEVLAAEHDIVPLAPVDQQRLHNRACIISSYAETDEFVPAVHGEFIPADDSGVEYISSSDGVPAEDAPIGGEGAGSSGNGNGAEDGGEAQSHAEPEADVAPPP